MASVVPIPWMSGCLFGSGAPSTTREIKKHAFLGLYIVCRLVIYLMLLFYYTTYPIFYSIIPLGLLDKSTINHKDPLR